MITGFLPTVYQGTVGSVCHPVKSSRETVYIVAPNDLNQPSTFCGGVRFIRDGVWMVSWRDAIGWHMSVFSTEEFAEAFLKEHPYIPAKR